MPSGTGQTADLWATCPVLHHPNKLFSYIQAKTPLLQFETFSPCPVTTDSAKESVLFFLAAPP